LTGKDENNHWARFLSCCHARKPGFCSLIEGLSDLAAI